MPYRADRLPRGSTPYRRPSRSLDGNLAALWRVHGRRKIGAAVEALLGSLDHKCTLVHLALGGPVWLGYRGGRSTSREQGQRGAKVPDVRSEYRPPNAFSHPEAFPAIGGRIFLSLLHISDRHGKALDGILAAVLCQLSRLPNHTEGGLAFSRLPAPQCQAHSEEQIVVVTLTPRLELHPARGYVGCAAVVLELVHEGLAVGDLPDPDLPLLKCCDGWE